MSMIPQPATTVQRLAPSIRVGPVRRMLWVLALLVPGLVLALMLGSVEYRPTGGTRGGWLIAEVNRERSFTQSFVVTRDGLAGVQLLLFRSGLNPQLAAEPVTVRLRTTLRPGPDLAIATLRLGDLNPDGPTEFRFKGFRYSPVFAADVISTSLYFQVEAPTLAVGSGLMIAGTSDNYHDGVLRVGEKRFTRFDLAFTPVYAPLLGDRFLPLSRLILDRPGLLGWPSFYVLLIYCYILAAVAMLWQLARRLHS